MGILGLVVEYNPFHLGHLHHLQLARQLTNSSAVVAVMSGNFTQRGEPAIVDKWARTEMALQLGVDLVVELPVAWAVRSAAHFAEGAIGLLAALGATHLCFGSETGQVEPLTEAAGVLLAESDEFRQHLRSALKEGVSFAEAQGKALRSVAPGLPDNIFSEPNNTLGIQYIQTILRYGLPITPITIPREGHYHSLEKNERLPSARAIRESICSGDEIFGMPDTSSAILQQRFVSGQGPVAWRDFGDQLIYRLRSLKRSDMESFPEASEGLGTRLWEAARRTHRLPELVSQTKTRRFPLTRLQRLLCYILLDISNKRIKSITADGVALPYARVLGINKANRTVLSMLAACKLPVVTAIGKSLQMDERATASLELDTWATDCYTLAWRDSQAGLDYLRRLLCVERSD